MILLIPKVLSTAGTLRSARPVLIRQRAILLRISRMVTGSCESAHRSADLKASSLLRVRYTRSSRNCQKRVKPQNAAVVGYPLESVFWYKGRMLDNCVQSSLTSATPPNGDDYRRLAGQIRVLARYTRLPVARNELIQLATRYEQRADHLDRPNYY